MNAMKYNTKSEITLYWVHWITQYKRNYGLQCKWTT